MNSCGTSVTGATTIEELEVGVSGGNILSASRSAKGEVIAAIITPAAPIIATMITIHVRFGGS